MALSSLPWLGRYSTASDTPFVRRRRIAPWPSVGRSLYLEAIHGIAKNRADWQRRYVEVLARRRPEACSDFDCRRHANGDRAHQTSGALADLIPVFACGYRRQLG